MSQKFAFAKGVCEPASCCVFCWYVWSYSSRQEATSLPMEVKQQPASLLKVFLSEAEPSMLVKLRDAINVCMSRITREPLQQLCQNLPSVVIILAACLSYFAFQT